MRSASVLLLILVAVLATINAAPANTKKTFSVPFRLVYGNNTTARLTRRNNAKIPLRPIPDVAFVGKIQVGTPPQTFEVIFDTASSYVGIADALCTNCGNPAIPMYSGRQSSTFVDIKTDYADEFYDSSYMTGTWTLDVFNFGGSIPVPMFFGRVMQMPDAWVAQGFSGVVGLRFRLPEGPYDFPSTIDLLDATSVLDENIVSFRFVKNDPQNGGEIVFGGVEPDFVDGDIQYTEVIPVDGAPDWIITIDDLQVAGKSIAQGAAALVDTGSSFIYLSEPVVETLYANTGAKLMDDGFWAVPDPFPSDLTFVVGNGQFMVPKADIPLKNLPKYGDMYFGAIQTATESEEDDDGGNPWVLGIPFIKNQYVVFDFGNEQIGLGKRKDYNPPSAKGMSSH